MTQSGMTKGAGGEAATDPGAGGTTAGGTTIVIVDDHPLFRGALVQALNSRLPGVELPVDVKEAGDFEALSSILATADNIDLVLLDLAMPGVSGLSGLLALRSQYETVPVIVVSANDERATIARALQLGASAFVPKSAGIDTLREAISAVLRGEIWQPEELDLLAEEDDEMADLVERLNSLTPQQSRVLSMISEGLLNKQIAYELSVSEATVKAHVSAVLHKLDVDSRTQAVIRLNQLTKGTSAVT